MPQEKPDFPFYNDHPRPLGTAGCLCILAACVGGFAALVAAPRVVSGLTGSWIGAVLFAGLQLLGLAFAAGPAWRTFFRRPTGRAVATALVCVPLVFGLPALVAFAVVGAQHMTSNSAIVAAGGMTAAQAVSFFGMSAIQLFGEELVTILPFLVVLTLLHRSGVKKGVATGVAWLVTALVFGALHLPTYEWHVGQALLVIGAARMALTGVYVLTRNIWASTIAHIANDWLLLGLAMLASMRST